MYHRDYRLDEILTLEEFTRMYINMVLYHNSEIIDKYIIDRNIIDTLATVSFIIVITRKL